MEDDGTYTVIDSQKVAEGTVDPWFTNPYAKYDYTTLDSMQKLHYDFLGWSTTNSADNLISNIDATTQEKDEAWTALRENIFYDNVYDYTFYAIYTIHKYNLTFYGGEKESEIVAVAYGDNVVRPSIIPYIDDSDLPLTSTYSFIEYTTTKSSAMTNNYLVIDENASTSGYTDITNRIVMEDMVFYPIFQPSSVYDNIHPEYFTITNKPTSASGCTIAVNSKYVLTGKITVPTTLNGYTVTALDDGAFSTYSTYKKQTENVTHIFWQEDNRKITSIPYRCCY
jgi:hypothetical protein